MYAVLSANEIISSDPNLLFPPFAYYLDLEVLRTDAAKHETHFMCLPLVKDK